VPPPQANSSLSSDHIIKFHRTVFNTCTGWRGWPRTLYPPPAGSYPPRRTYQHPVPSPPATCSKHHRPAARHGSHSLLHGIMLGSSRQFNRIKAGGHKFQTGFMDRKTPHRTSNGVARRCHHVFLSRTPVCLYVSANLTHYHGPFHQPTSYPSPVWDGPDMDAAIRAGPGRTAVSRTSPLSQALPPPLVRTFAPGTTLPAPRVPCWRCSSTDVVRRRTGEHGSARGWLHSR